MGRKQPAAAPSSAHVLRAQLHGIEPPIWRELAVRSDVSLTALHRMLQAAFGWDDEHPHLFEAKGCRYTEERALARGDGDEADATLGEVLPRARARLRYWYDFGDGWEVRVSVLRIDTSAAGQPAAPLARLLGGARAAPPEDCGGIGGYLDLLAASSDPDHPDRDLLLEPFDGEPIDGEAFDRERIEARLAALESGGPRPPRRSFDRAELEWDEDPEDAAEEDEEFDLDDPYDADEAPDPTAWLDRDEGERLLAVETYHRRGAFPTGESARLHAVVHVVAENALALGEPPAVRHALERLTQGGVPRHEAIHAIAGVYAALLHATLLERKAADLAKLARDLDALDPESLA